MSQYAKLHQTYCFSAPSGLAAPTIANVQARQTSIAWSPPAVSGGLLTKYQINALDATNSSILIVAEITATSLRAYNISGLEPYTFYNLSIVAFTSGGSVESAHVQTRTSPSRKFFTFTATIYRTHDQNYLLKKCMYIVNSI